MGRPIKEKFFGNTNSPYSNQAVGGGTGVGGEGVASVTVTGSGSGQTGTVTVLFSAPQIPGGVTAVGTAVKTGSTVTSVTVDVAGSGYLSAPTVWFNASHGTTGTATASLTSTRQNAIRGVAYISTGTAAREYDILKQESSRRYMVRTSEGKGIVKLVAVTGASLTAGQMNMIASDTNGSTYFVKKLTARRAVLVQSTASGSFLFDTNEAAGWTLGSASSGVVSLSNG